MSTAILKSPRTDVNNKMALFVSHGLYLKLIFSRKKKKIKELVKIQLEI